MGKNDVITPMDDLHDWMTGGRRDLCASMGICGNQSCGCDLEVDHITVVTTWHVLRFCSMECVVTSWMTHADAIFNSDIPVGQKKVVGKIIYEEVDE